MGFLELGTSELYAAVNEVTEGRLSESGLDATIDESVAERVARNDPTDGAAPSVIIRGDSAADLIAGDVSRSIILGGGYSYNNNVIGGDGAATVGTTTPNTTTPGTNAHVSLIGGYDNVAGAISSKIISDHSYVGTDATEGHNAIYGGSNNKIDGDGTGYATISGGKNNHVSADRGTIAGGEGNTVSGSYSFCAGQVNTISGGDSAAFGSANTITHNASAAFGASNEVNASYSAVFGRYARTRSQGQIAYSQSRFASTGDAQVSMVVLSKTTTDGTANQLLGLAGTTAQHSLLEGQTVAVTYTLVARDTSTGDSKAWRVEGLVKREVGGVATMIAAITKTVLGASAAAATWDTLMSPSGATLGIRVTGETGKTIRWVAKCDMVEVGSF